MWGVRERFERRGVATMQESMHAAGRFWHSGETGGVDKAKTLKITANMVTILRIVLMPIPGYLLYGGEGSLLVALLLTILLGLTDLLDGIMARREGTSVLGGLLDPIADKIFIAVIYLPLTDRGIFPVWLTAAMFARDFAVTTLRSSLSLRDAPMRTATLAKYKTAIQMTGVGYIILFLAYAGRPDAFLVWLAITAPIVLPLGLILYRAIRGRKQGPRSITMLALTAGCWISRWFLGPDVTTIVMSYIIAALTVVSGFSYFSDAWSSLKNSPGRGAEIFRFAVEGVLVPVIFVSIFYFYHTAFISTAVIIVITLELSAGGLGNLLASRKIEISLGRSATKSVLQVIAGATAIAVAIAGVSETAGAASIAVALAVTAAWSIFLFVRYRDVYLSAV